MLLAALLPWTLPLAITLASYGVIWIVAGILSVIQIGIVCLVELALRRCWPLPEDPAERRD